MNYAVRLSLAYADCSGIISLWSDRASKVSVFEHPSDGNVKRTHCHIGLWGLDCKSEALKRMVPNRGKGNEYWSWKELKEDPGTGTFLSYCSKGIHTAKFLKNISPVLVDSERSKWVNKVPDNPKSSIPKSEFERLLNYCESKYKANDIPSVNVIKCDICYCYLSKRQSVPRTGDLNRYAYSIYIIMSSDKSSMKDVTMQSLISNYVIMLDS